MPHRARRFLTAGLMLMTVATAAFPAISQEALTPAQRQAVEAIVRDIILKNPELILQAVENLEQQRKSAEAERVSAALAANRQALHGDAGSYVAGNPQGDVTVVEFFDYRCGYCKQVQPQVTSLLKQDGRLRLVLKEFPILGMDSVVASRAAIASRAQGKYLPFHDALMQSRGTLTEPTVMQIAAEVGLDLERLKADMKAPEVDRVIKDNYTLAQALGIQGTPAFVIGDELVPGAVDLDRLKELVAAARSDCRTC